MPVSEKFFAGYCRKMLATTTLMAATGTHWRWIGWEHHIYKSTNVMDKDIMKMGTGEIIFW